jgi:predicted nucleotidyltransferase
MTERAALDVGELLRALVQRGVDFVVIGGIAAVLQGSARNTFDLDICFAVDPTNLKALATVLTELQARLRGVDEQVPFVADERTLSQIEVLTLVTTFGELDLLARPAGAPTYARLRARAERFDIGGVAVSVAAIDDLIAMKRAAGRAKDLADIEELETIKQLRRN